MTNQQSPFDNPEWLAISRETKLVCQLVGSGVTSLGRASYGDMMGEYYTAFFGLSVGLERLAKLILVVDYAISNSGNMPNQDVVRKFGHKLARLLDAVDGIEKKYSLNLPYKRLADDISDKIIDCLDDFADATRGRYANFAVLGDPNLSQHEPIQRWWDDVATLILERHYTGGKIQANIEARAEMVHKMLSPNSVVLQVNESGALMQDVHTASLRAGQAEVVQRFGRYYVLLVIRWISCVLSELSRKACYHHKLPAFFGVWEHLYTYTVNDDFLKRRKIWPLK